MPVWSLISNSIGVRHDRRNPTPGQMPLAGLSPTLIDTCAAVRVGLRFANPTYGLLRLLPQPFALSVAERTSEVEVEGSPS